MTMPLQPFALLLAFLVACLSMVTLRVPALTLDLVDRPGGRKQHRGDIPLIGGVGIILGFIAAVMVLDGPLRAYLPLLAAMGLLTVCGLVDDARDMRSVTKLFMQAAAATLVVAWGGQVVEVIGTYAPVGAVALGPWAVPLTLFAVVGVINAVNMTDGLDGLAGGVVFAMLGWLLVVAALQGNASAAALIAALMAAVVAFLLFNLRLPWRRCATVFLGDAGSMALGLAVTWFVIELSQAKAAVVSPVAFGWILALPVMDTLSLMVRRLVKGQSPFAADREHLHHIFLRAGYTPGQASYVLIAICAALGAVGVLGSLAGMPDWLLLLGLMITAILHYVFIRHAWRTMRALRRLSIGRQSGAVPCSGGGLGGFPVAGWRRHAALFGIYVAVFCLPFSRAGMNVGLALVVLVTFFAFNHFWRAACKLGLAWLVLALTGFVLLRGLAATGFDSGAGSPSWGYLIRVTGLLSLPLGWWLAGARVHWFWIMMTLVAGGAVAFVDGADWDRLNAGFLSDPTAWGSRANSGFMGAVILMLLLAGVIAAVQRLGRGWRPWFGLVGCAALSVPVVVVLVGTHYATGWVGALVGALVISLGAIRYGANRRQWFGLVGGALMVAAVGGIAWTVIIAGSGPSRAAFTEPVQAAGLYMGGEPALAGAIHQPTVERLRLWGSALDRFAERPIVGWGDMSPRAFDGPMQSFVNYQTLYGAVAVGFGLLGLGLFGAVVAGFVYEFLALARERLWPVAWVLGMLGAIAAVLTMLALAIHIDQTSSRTMIVLLMAAGFAAAFQRRWLREARDAHSGHVPPDGDS